MKNYCNLLNNVKWCFVFLLFLVFSCSSCGVFSDGATKNSSTDEVLPDGVFIDSEGRLSITQFGITWLIYKADQNYTYGLFANGDHWVVGPVDIVGISPKTTVVSGRTKNGSMKDPIPGNLQGYDSAIEGTYSASLNVALGLSASTPLEMLDGTSLVSTRSLDNPESGADRPKLKTAAVLTVLSTAPATGSFRPPYCGTGKSVQFNVSSLNYSLLKSLAPVANTPVLPDVAKYFERVWLDHVGGWLGRALHPVDNMPDYGSILSSQVSDGALMLHLDFTDSEKQTLLIRYVQLGIDNFGIVSNNHNIWEPDGGHCGGRKWPILFAGLMLNDTSMKAIGQKSGDYLYTISYGPGNIPSDYIHFQEDGQTFYVIAADVALSATDTEYHGVIYHGHFYPPDAVDLAEYTASHIGMPEWGIRHSTNPLWDGNEWAITYRVINAYSWAGFILSARMMNANTPLLWNNSALFDYEDRHMAVTATNDLTPVWRYNTYSAYTGDTSFIQNVWAKGRPDGTWRTTSKFMANMWDEYRDNY